MISKLLKRKRERGNLEAIEGDKGRPPKLTEEAKAVIFGVLAEQPDTYDRELKRMLEEVMGITVATSTVYSFLDSVGYEKKAPLPLKAGAQQSQYRKTETLEAGAGAT